VGRLPRTGAVGSRRRAHVQPATSAPRRRRTSAPGAVVYPAADDLDARRPAWGDTPQTVCHAAGEGCGEVQVHTLAGVWSWRRSWRRPHRGLSQEQWPSDVSCFAFVHHVRRRGKA